MLWRCCLLADRPAGSLFIISWGFLLTYDDIDWRLCEWCNSRNWIAYQWWICVCTVFSFRIFSSSWLWAIQLTLYSWRVSQTEIVIKWLSKLVMCLNRLLAFYFSEVWDSLVGSACIDSLLGEFSLVPYLGGPSVILKDPNHLLPPLVM